MIPFNRLYSWLFKSFNISGETALIDRLISEWYEEIMIIKRSWIFALFMIWLPMAILGLSWLSIYIAYDSIDIASIKYTLIGGNILMSMILIGSSLNYIIHYRSIHDGSHNITDTQGLRDNLHDWDRYFASFFNWSITNQWILVGIIIVEIGLILAYGNKIGDHFWILATDTLVILMEIVLLRHYRKRMMDLEMDYNIVVPGKIFFVNQSWLLSTVQTIDSDKIKTVQSIFPSKIASFFNYGTVNVLTEGDQAMIGTMSMFYVTNPDAIVAQIQSLIETSPNSERAERNTDTIDPIVPKPSPKVETRRHTIDTREKIRDVLR